MKHRVFVYGTLLAGEGNHHVLNGSRCLGEARTACSFRMFDMGAFPGVVAGGSNAIVGEVYEVSAETLERLDRLEGHPRFYRRTQITLDGLAIDAETYLLLPAQVVGRPEIKSGAWRSRWRRP